MGFCDINFCSDKIDNFKDAIEIGVKQLVKHDKATLELSNAIMDSIAQHGPYFVIAPFVALAHAAPGSYCKEAALAITVFENIVKFSNDQKHDVKVLITLSAPNSNDHIELIQWFGQKFGDKNFTQKVIDAKSLTELKEILG